MGAYRAALGALTRVNTVLLAAGRQIAWVLMAVMMVVILGMIFWRGAFGTEPAWSRELALGLMVWMVSMMAPSALRWQGFVAIEMVPDALPRRVGQVLKLLILCLTLAVVAFLLQRSWIEYNAVTLFNSSAVNRLVQDIGINQLLGTNFEFRTSLFTVSMCIGFAVMLLVNVELIGRAIGRIVWGDEPFPEPKRPLALVAAAE